MILLIVYFILGYWSVGRTIYGNLIAYTDGFNLFLKKCLYAIFLGWITIPWALLKMLFGNKTTLTICFAYRANRRGLFVSLQKGLPITWQPLFGFILLCAYKLN